MGVQIISGATSDILTVDPTTKAARVTLYDAFGNLVSDNRTLANIVNALNDAATLVLGGQSTMGVDVSATSGTLTLSFEATIDGISWFAVKGDPVGGGVGVFSVTGDGQWIVTVGGYHSARARISAFTSGSMTVSLLVTPGASKSGSQTVSGNVGITDGVNGPAAVKAPSTPAGASDEALVVAVSPNNTVAVSAASLPLPTGAATAANQTTLGSQTTKLNDGTNTAAVTAANALKVDGSAVTQPVSAASLPLPTGASTSANQTNGNQQTQIVQGGNTAAVTGANALQVDGSAVTQPVSAASLPLPTGAATSANQTTLGSQTTKINDGTHTAAVTAANALTVDGSAVTQPVSAASLPLPTGAATAANQTTLGNQTTKINDGTNTATVKPASTAAIATDTALVVAISPNNSLTVANPSVGTNGAATPASSTLSGASDGTNLQPLQVESASNKNLRVGIYNGATEAAVTGANALKVDGSAVTQPVSAASLPLPTGAATSANQTTLGNQTTKINDGTHTASVSVGGALLVDGSATTQPISAASLPLPTGAATSANQTTLGNQTTKLNDGTNTAAVTAANALKVDGSAVTQPVSAASLPLPTGAATSANQTTLGSQTSKINDGTNTAAVKAASTAAAATDPALVVALSPNNTPFAFGGDDRLRVGQETLLFYDNIEGTTIDLNRWVQSQLTMTQAQTSGALTLNSGSDTTNGDYSILKSSKQVLISVEFPIYVQFRAKLVPQTNAVIELGFGFVATNAAPTDGVFFRIDSAGLLKGVINNNGTETLTASLGSLSATTFYNFEVTVYEDHASFEVSSADGATNIDVDLPIPATQGSPTSTGHQPVFARVYNSGTPGAAAQVVIASVSAQQMDLATNKTWAEQMSAVSRSSIYDPSTFGQTANYANSTVPAAATLSNTAAGYTTLGGLFRFATVAGAETDYALFAYQVPTGALLYIYNVTISTFVTGAASGGATPILLQWALAANSSAVSLATGAPNPPIFQTLGLQQVPRTATIGDAFTPGELVYSPNTPLVVYPSRFLHIVLRIPIAAALATQFIRGSVTIEGIFE